LSRRIIGLGRVPLAFTLALCVGACTGASATATPTLSDAARVWCSDYHNQAKLGNAAVTLGIDTAPVASAEIDSPTGGSETLSYMIRYWASGGDSDAFPSVMQKDVAAWEAISPDTFVRACLAAFNAR
jgi:hypothetical protein